MVKGVVNYYGIANSNPPIYVSASSLKAINPLTKEGLEKKNYNSLGLIRQDELATMAAAKGRKPTLVYPTTTGSFVTKSNKIVIPYDASGNIASKYALADEVINRKEYSKALRTAARNNRREGYINAFDPDDYREFKRTVPGFIPTNVRRDNALVDFTRLGAQAKGIKLNNRELAALYGVEITQAYKEAMRDLSAMQASAARPKKPRKRPSKMKF